MCSRGEDHLRFQPVTDLYVGLPLQLMLEGVDGAVRSKHLDELGIPCTGEGLLYIGMHVLHHLLHCHIHGWRTVLKVPEHSHLLHWATTHCLRRPSFPFAVHPPSAHHALLGRNKWLPSSEALSPVGHETTTDLCRRPPSDIPSLHLCWVQSVVGVKVVRGSAVAVSSTSSFGRRPPPAGPEAAQFISHVGRRRHSSREFVPSSETSNKNSPYVYKPTALPSIEGVHSTSIGLDLTSFMSKAVPPDNQSVPVLSLQAAAPTICPQRQLVPAPTVRRLDLHGNGKCNPYNGC